MSTNRTITWTRERAKQLRAAYDEARRRGRGEFEVEIEGYRGKVAFDTGFAKHTLDFLEDVFRQPDVKAPPNLEGEEGQ